MPPYPRGIDRRVLRKNAQSDWSRIRPPERTILGLHRGRPISADDAGRRGKSRWRLSLPAVWSATFDNEVSLVQWPPWKKEDNQVWKLKLRWTVDSTINISDRLIDWLNDYSFVRLIDWWLDWLIGSPNVDKKIPSNILLQISRNGLPQHFQCQIPQRQFKTTDTNTA